MHPRFAPILFGFLLSGLMSLVVSGIATVRAVGLVDGFPALWMSSWLVAFPTVLVVAPLVRRLVAGIVRETGQ